MNMSALVFFAQNDAAAPVPGSQIMAFLPFILIGLAFYFILIRPQQRKDQQHRQTLNAIKKDDRIVTVGGIYGIVTNVRKDDDRITLRVDDATNTKIDITFNAVARVVVDEPSSEKTSK